jgi:hypothetical protein
LSDASRRFLPGFVCTVVTTWRGGGCRRAAGRRPMAEGGASSGVCAAGAWHQPRGGQRVTPYRRTVPTAPGLGPLGFPASRRACSRGYSGVPTWRVRRDVVRCRRPGSNSFQATNFKMNFFQISKLKWTKV